MLAEIQGLRADIKPVKKAVEEVQTKLGSLEGKAEESATAIAELQRGFGEVKSRLEAEEQREKGGGVKDRLTPDQFAQVLQQEKANLSEAKLLMKEEFVRQEDKSQKLFIIAHSWPEGIPAGEKVRLLREYEASAKLV